MGILRFWWRWFSKIEAKRLFHRHLMTTSLYTLSRHSRHYLDRHLFRSNDTAMNSVVIMHVRRTMGLQPQQKQQKIIIKMIWGHINGSLDRLQMMMAKMLVHHTQYTSKRRMTVLCIPKTKPIWRNWRTIRRTTHHGQTPIVFTAKRKNERKPKKQASVNCYKWM